MGRDTGSEFRDLYKRSEGGSSGGSSCLPQNKGSNLSLMYELREGMGRHQGKIDPRHRINASGQEKEKEELGKRLEIIRDSLGKGGERSSSHVN